MESNYIYFLFAVMFFITLSILIVLDFDLLQPSVIFSGILTISMLFSVLNVDKWNLHVGMQTFCVVIAGIFSYVFGSLYCHMMLYDLKNNEIKSNRKYIFLSSEKLAIGFFVVVVIACFDFIELNNLATKFGNTQGVLNIISTVRPHVERQETVFTRWTNYRNLVAQAVTYIFIFYGLDLLINFKKFYVMYFLPALAYVPITILSTGRSSMLFFMTYIVMVYLFLYLKYNKYAYRSIKKSVVTLLITGCFFIGTFLLMGTLTGKGVSLGRGPFAIVSHYVGLSIPALDKFLDKTPIEDTYIGKNTLSIYNNLNSLGFDIPKLPTFLEFVQFSGIDTNVYTLLRFHIEDYGFLGMNLILCMFGIGMTYVYEFIKFETASPLLIMIYMSYMGNFLLTFHGSDLLMTLTNTSFIYTIIAFWTVNKFCVSRIFNEINF